MFNLFKPKPKNNPVIPAKAGIHKSTVTLHLSGLHCTSCAVNIDLTLEDVPGVINSNTNYQKSEVIISYDTTKTNTSLITKEILDLGYQVEK
jgi:Cu+-exporting ATPase